QRGVITKNSGNVLKTCSATDATYWKILYDGSSMKFYDSNGLFAQTTVTVAISKLALVAGAYEWTSPVVTYLDYIQINELRVRAYASSEPTSTVGSEEPLGAHPMYYYHNSPVQFGGIVDTWAWSNFTWNNPTIQGGTTIAWKIWYEDTSGNWNSTNTMTFLVYHLTSAPTIESCDVAGTAKDQFNLGETIYVKGNGYPPYARSYSIYVVEDVVTWTDGMSIPPRVSGTATTISADSSGTIIPTSVGSQLTLGRYDIVVDLNGNGKYEVGIDALYSYFFIRGPSLTFNPDSKTCRMYGETFTVQVSVTNVYDVEGFRFEIHYNATLLDVSTVSWTAFGTGTWTADEINGILTGYSSGNPLSGNLTLVTITFDAAYYHIWKDERTVSGWKNIQTGTIYIQWANLSYPSGSDLGYVRGGSQNQINVGPDVTYTFSPIQGDVNKDGKVDIFDLRTVAAYYNQQNSAYDLNGDDTIDIFDLVEICINFGYTYTP
ncbi:dockerin type I domain-containing protein, partial [Candidatus Bathyarchaeota archaeon]|nr:dockerin type I domain-containing protein [Candidatus Bathyarchaeota archaeon]